MGSVPGTGRTGGRGKWGWGGGGRGGARTLGRRKLSTRKNGLWCAPNGPRKGSEARERVSFAANSFSGQARTELPS